MKPNYGTYLHDNYEDSFKEIETIKQLQKKTQPLPTSDHEWTSSNEFNLETDGMGHITGPWPEVMEAYLKITDHGHPECSKCEVEMLQGDNKFICHCCDNKYQVGTSGENIHCFRPDIRPACMDQVDVPDKFMKDYLTTWSGETDNFKIITPSNNTYITPNGGIDGDGGIDLSTGSLKNDSYTWEFDEDKLIWKNSNEEDE